MPNKRNFLYTTHNFLFNKNTHTHTLIYLYVCVCVCFFLRFTLYCTSRELLHIVFTCEPRPPPQTFSRTLMAS